MITSSLLYHYANPSASYFMKPNPHPQQLPKFSLSVRQNLLQVDKIFNYLKYKYKISNYLRPLCDSGHCAPVISTRLSTSVCTVSARKLQSGSRSRLRSRPRSLAVSHSRWQQRCMRPRYGPGQGRAGGVPGHQVASPVPQIGKQYQLSIVSKSSLNIYS